MISELLEDLAAMLMLLKPGLQGKDALVIAAGMIDEIIGEHCLETFAKGVEGIDSADHILELSNNYDKGGRLAKLLRSQL